MDRAPGTRLRLLLRRMVALAGRLCSALARLSRYGRRRQGFADLLSPEALLARARRIRAMEGGAAAAGLWLAVVHLTVKSWAADQGHGSSARERALEQLCRNLRGQEGLRALGLGAGRDLLVLLSLPAPMQRDAVEQRWQQIDQQLQQQLGKAMDLRCRLLLAALQPGPLEPQLSDLLLLIGSSEVQDHWQVLPDGAAAAAQQLRDQISCTFDLTRLGQSLAHHGHRLEPIWQIRGQRRTLLYEELLFRLPPELAAGVSVQTLIQVLEQQGYSHWIDHLMLQRACALLRAEPQRVLAINVSACTLQSDPQRRVLLELLTEGLPAGAWTRLVLEITETALLDPEPSWLEDLERIRGLGLRLAMDDFGVGHASLASLFRLQPDVLKLDLYYSQRLHDPDVDALVLFLQSYAANHGITLVLEGIESDEQLSYWQERGVTHFQGHLFRPAANH